MIICEEIIGLFSSLQQLSPNSTIINITSKIKATKNKTLKHIMAMGENDRNYLISYD